MLKLWTLKQIILKG